MSALHNVSARQDILPHLQHFIPSLHNIAEREKDLEDDVLNQMLQAMSRMGELKGSLKSEGRQLDIECNQLQASVAAPLSDYPKQWKVLSASVSAKLEVIYDQIIVQKNNYQSMSWDDYSKQSWSLSCSGRNVEDGRLWANYLFSIEFHANWAQIALFMNSTKHKLQHFVLKIKEQKVEQVKPLVRSPEEGAVIIKDELQLIDHKAGAVFRANVQILTQEIASLQIQNVPKKEMFYQLQIKDEQRHVLEQKNVDELRAYRALINEEVVAMKKRVRIFSERLDEIVERKIGIREHKDWKWWQPSSLSAWNQGLLEEIKKLVLIAKKDCDAVMVSLNVMLEEKIEF